jgi:hypothetical protein
MSPRILKPDITPINEPEELGTMKSIRKNLMHIFLSYGDFNLKGD